MHLLHALKTPSVEDYWRGIILYGRNVQSYKFALAKSLLEMTPQEGELIKIEDLAPIYSKHLTEHLKISDTQGTAPTSKFLKACREYNRGEISDSKLVTATLALGFNNVIDAFHRVGQDDVPLPFYVDERKSHGGLRITENFSLLAEASQFDNLAFETEARWRLVETAWELKVSRALVSIDHDPATEKLFAIDDKRRRKSVTNSRDALNGYQLGYCFYCYDELALEKSSSAFPEVDHFFPHSLKQYDIGAIIDGVWNLVLACKDCNRGPGGKFDRIPSLALLRRLHQRNEFLIESNHPLKETLMRQTGNKLPDREGFLDQFYGNAKMNLIHEWEPFAKGPKRF